MKIKKSIPAKVSGAESNGAIADRFRLDPIDATAARSSTSRKAAMYALVFGLIALAVTVTLTITIYKHWEFLMPA